LPSCTSAIGEGGSELRTRLIDDLRIAYKPTPKLSALDAAVVRIAHDHSNRRDMPQATHKSHRLRLRVAAPISALVMVALSLGAYLHGQGPTLASAQTVLHRAAAASPGADQATHATYRLSASGGLTGTASVWIGFDASGSPTQFSLTQTMLNDGNPAPGLSTTLGAGGQTLLRAYDPAHSPLMVPSSATPAQALEGMFVGTLLAQKLSRQPSAFKLEQQTLDGVPVYALKLGASGNQTYYFSAKSYVLEVADWVQDDRSWHARLDPASYRTMALSAVPPNTFGARTGGPVTGGTTGGKMVSGSAPGGIGIGIAMGLSIGGKNGSGTGLTISVSMDGLKGPVVDITSAMITACNTTPQAFMAATQAGDRSVLTICQLTNPSMTADRLVAALTAPVKSALGARVSWGAITSAQETDDLVSLQKQLTHLVTASIGMSQSGAGTTVHLG
jgi:hypothetical protein